MLLQQLLILLSLVVLEISMLKVAFKLLFEVPNRCDFLSNFDSILLEGFHGDELLQFFYPPHSLVEIEHILGLLLDPVHLVLNRGNTTIN